MEHESDGDTNCNWCARYSHQKIDKETGELGNKRMRGDHPNDSIIKISPNTKKNDALLSKMRGTKRHGWWGGGLRANVLMKLIDILNWLAFHV